MNKKIILGIMIVGIIFGSIGVYAGSNFYANGISVSAPAGSNLGSGATLQNSLDELYSIADKYDELKKEMNLLKTNTLSLDKLYPVGSIFLSTTNTNPSTFLGGTWEAYGASDTYLRLGGNGSGGSNSVKLSANQIPTHTTGNQSTNHTHSIPALSGATSSAGSHVHYSKGYLIANSGFGNGVGGGSGAGIAITDLANVMYPSGEHTHTIATNASTTGGNNQNHTHTYTNNSQQNVNITPKYVQVYAFKRTA